MATKLEKLIRSMPPELRPRTNSVLNTLLRAYAQEDQEVLTQLENTKAQLFVRTAEGVYLDRVASNFGVARPSELGLLDEDFQKLIPNLSLKQKQVSRSFYDTMDVFWGPTFSRANIVSGSTPTYNLVSGDSITIKLDGGVEQTITVKPGDITSPGFATSIEVLELLNRVSGLTATLVSDPTTGSELINIRTDTPGTRGSIEVVSGFSDLNFLTGVRVRITDLAQRTVLYQISPGEVLIELPAIVPTLRRTLRGSHHFHADSTIEPAVAPNNGVWQGSFLYSTTQNQFVVTQTKGILESKVIKGSVISQITLDSTDDFSVDGGSLIFNFGKSNEEQPVSYITVPNSKTLLIDPGHSFQFTHELGSSVNLLLPDQTTAYAPRVNGSDLAIYLTSPSNARVLVQEILKSLTAAGISVKFLILLPEYRYLLDNPYTD